MAGLRSSPSTWSMVGQSSLARAAALAAASPFCLESGTRGERDGESGRVRGITVEGRKEEEIGELCWDDGGEMFMSGRDIRAGNREDGRGERRENMEETVEGRKRGKRIAGVADVGGKREV